MDIMIYKCNAEVNRLDKNQFLTGGISATATIKGTFRADAPELYLDYHGELTGYNYIRATINGVYMYYFARFSADTGQTVRASCSRDPLMSFAAQILDTPIYVTRCEQQATESNLRGWDTYIRDPLIQKSAREFTIVKIDTNFPKFEYPDASYPDTRQYILGVIG